jgi:transposase
MTPEDLKEIERLFQSGMKVRAIARKLGRDPKTVRRALRRSAQLPETSKLERFKDAIRQRHEKGLFAPRILRELREMGYRGGLTILKDFLRTLDPKTEPKKVFRRFETKPGEEAQCDWSPYRPQIAGRETLIHCFSLILCRSRKMFIAFFRNERLPTLLFAHVQAFAYLQGLCARIVYDNQTAVTVGRLRGKPIWNPTFLQFSKHYGFRPFAHRPRHKERSGKVERPFWYIETDFLKGKTFTSWEDLNHQARVWLDGVANVRKHSTTGRLIHEAYLEERPFLITLPTMPYHAERREVRKVLTDGTVSIDGSFYPAPAHLVGRQVAVRIDPDHVEILDASGQVAARHRVPDTPMRLPSDGGPPPVPGKAPLARSALEARFLAVFPQAERFLEGIVVRMRGLASVHLRQIERLVYVYGPGKVAPALERAIHYRNWSAQAVARILEAAHPDVIPELSIPTFRGDPAILGALDDIESGSLSDYTLDSMPPTAKSDPNPPPGGNSP